MLRKHLPEHVVQDTAMAIVFQLHLTIQADEGLQDR